MGCIGILADALKLAPGLLGEELTEKGCCLAAKLLRWLEALPAAVSDGICLTVKRSSCLVVSPLQY